MRPPVSTLTKLTDVLISSPASGQALLYNSGTSKWNNGTVPGGALSTLTDVVLGVVVDKQFLKYDAGSGKWVNYGPLAFTDITGNINVSQMASGSGASSATFWRGDGTWAASTSADPGTTGNVMTSDGTNWVSLPAGMPAGGTAKQVLSKNTGTDYDASWITLSTAALQTTTISTPTGTTNTTTGVMVGLGASVSAVITPVRSGKIFVTIAGSCANNTVNCGGDCRIYWSTGTAPANGAAATGNPVGGLAQRRGNWPVSVVTPFSLSAIITGLTLGTQIWLDLVQVAVAGGTYNVQNVAVTACELP
jgi:hypothetical protein